MLDVAFHAKPQLWALFSLLFTTLPSVWVSFFLPNAGLPHAVAFRQQKGVHSLAHSPDRQTLVIDLPLEFLQADFVKKAIAAKSTPILDSKKPRVVCSSRSSVADGAKLLLHLGRATLAIYWEYSVTQACTL